MFVTYYEHSYITTGIMEAMQINHVLEHFGNSQTKLAQALGIFQSNVARWVKNEQIPHLRQIQIQLLTKGKLKADAKAQKAMA